MQLRVQLHETCLADLHATRVALVQGRVFLCMMQSSLVRLSGMHVQHCNTAPCVGLEPLQEMVSYWTLLQPSLTAAQQNK